MTDPKPPSFSGGATEDVHAFIKHFQDIHLSSKEPSSETKDKVILSAMVDNLQGDALTYFDTLPSKTRKDWTKLGAALKERYENPPGTFKTTIVDDLFAPLYKLKQGDRKLAEYAREFEKAAEYLSPQGHFQLMGAARFVSSLSDDVTKKHLLLLILKIISFGKFPTVEEVVEAAVLWDETSYEKQVEELHARVDRDILSKPSRTYRVNVHGDIIDDSNAA